MTETPQTVPTAKIENGQREQGDEMDAVEILLREFSQEAGKRVGNALAEQIQEDPEVRRAAARGAGLGMGIVVGLAILSNLD